MIDRRLGYLLITLAPSAFSKTLLSRLIDAGIVKISSYPFAAATIANPMPVLPEVGSTKTVFPGINVKAVKFSVVMESNSISLVRYVRNPAAFERCHRSQNQRLKYQV